MCEMLKLLCGVIKTNLEDNKKYISIDLNCHCMISEKKKKELTPTWFEHATFWSGVRRATVAPRGLKISKLEWLI